MVDVEEQDSSMAALPTVKSITVYPIKSCRGISVLQAPITSTGFRWDRQWMVVNSRGRAYTQRVEPKLALVEVVLPDEAFIEDWKPNSNSFLEVKAPGMNVLKVPLTKPPETVGNVSVWEWCGSALNEGNYAARWFSTYLGKASQLVRFHDESEARDVDSNYALGYKIMFSDQYPFLLISQGSLNALNDLLREPVLNNRFRPNILVDGCLPFSEDLWAEIQINKLAFYGVKLCSRCKVYFGQNLVCKECLSHGKGKKTNMSIKVGDPVYVLKMVSSPSEAAT